VRPNRLVLALLAGLVLTLAGCGGDGGGETGGEAGAGEQQEAPSTPEAEAAAGAIEVVTSGSAFNPAELQMTSGETVEVTVRNDDPVEHSFTFDEASVDQDVHEGETATVEVTAPEAGDYTFYCKYHPSMKGTVTVA
jgi:plastocyanin